MAVRWPNLFLVGAPKAATTSLWRFLSRHPDVYMSPVDEPHFLAERRDPGLAWVARDEQSYLRLFRGARGERYVGEASTSYLRDPQTPGAIARLSPQARIVISLREPVSRAWSGYWYGVRYGEQRGFLELVKGELAGDPACFAPHVGRGLYAEAIERYWASFGREGVHVLFFEELVADPRAELRRLLEFLEIDIGPAESVPFPRENAFGLPRSRFAAWLVSSYAVRRVSRLTVPKPVRTLVERHSHAPRERPPMEPEARRLLEEVYAPERERLARMLGRPLPWPPLVDAGKAVATAGAGA